MLRSRTELSLLRALAFFAAGILIGIQIGLYLFDFYDDGVADVRSGLIGLALFILGLGFVAWSYRGSWRKPPATPGTKSPSG